VGKLKNNQKGFSAVEAVLILVIIVLIGVVGYMVYKNHNNKTTTASVATSTTKKTTTSIKTVADPYSGWKTYCDSATKECFEYPPTWTLNTGASTNTEVIGPSKAVSVEYSNPSSDFGGPQTFHTISLAALAKSDSTLNVIGGYYTATNMPEYALIGSSLIQKNSLSVGQTSDNVGYLDYSSNGGSASLTASLYGSTTAPTPPSPVDSWFSSADAKTALLILQSFYKQ
jgi:hypothetical protein